MATRRNAEGKDRRERSLVDQHSYQVGGHIVRLTPDAGGWSVSVDGLHHGRRFGSAAEAWSAGLQTAEALDRSTADTIPQVRPGTGSP